MNDPSVEKKTDCVQTRTHSDCYDRSMPENEFIWIVTIGLCQRMSS